MTNDRRGGCGGERLPHRLQGRHGRAVGLAAALAVALAVGALAGFPGTVLAAPADGPQEPRDIASYQPQGRQTAGTPATRGAPRLQALGTYVDSIAAGETRHYSVRLDAESAAYLSAVAVPRPGSHIAAYADGITLSLVDSDGKVCDRTQLAADAVNLAHPLAGYAARLKRSGSAATCQRAGRYDFVIERTGDGGDEPERWPLELKFSQEAPVESGPTTPPSPGSWSTTPPKVPGEKPRERLGGIGFRDAGLLSTGVWTTSVAPGETRFYRIPLKWGQQIYAEAELPDAQGGGREVLGNAVGVSLYNPWRGQVQRGEYAPYRGERTKDTLELTAPVAYGNRYTRAKPAVEAMSTAGDYYLAVTLHPDARRYFGESAAVTLRVAVQGEAHPGPRYVKGGSGPGLGLDEGGQGAAAGNSAAEGDGGDGPPRAVAYAGFGAGTLLLLWLGVWTMIARRRGAASG